MSALIDIGPARAESQHHAFLHPVHDRIRLAISTLDVLPQRICVIDRSGLIVMANQAWQSFRDESDSDFPISWIGLNYFECPECTEAAGSDGGVALSSGIRSVIEGKAAEFVSEYRVIGGGEARWFRVRVSPFPDEHDCLLVVHEEVTKYRKHEAALLEITNELRGLATHLQNVKESERKRIARELHDELGQHLLCMKMDVSVLYESTNGIHPKFNERLGHVLKCIDGTMETVKSIINDLRPAALDLGLAAALRAHAQSFQRRTGIFCELLLEEAGAEMDGDRMTTLFRVVQESLVNVARHSNASRVRISMKREGETLTVVISDNGKGIPAGTPSRRGKFGLVGMRERINACGGRFSIEQGSSGGTCISASLPL